MHRYNTEVTEARRTPGTAGIAVALAAVLALALVFTAAGAAASERWLHVRVEKKGENAEMVKVNVPLALAEKVLGAVQVEKLKNGRLRFEQARIEGVDLKAILAAIRDVQDGEFVTIEREKENVRVSKSGGYLLVNVREGAGSKAKVNVRIPMTVVEALVSADDKELDLGAAVRALSQHGDFELVTVSDGNETVRVWVDSRSAQ